MLLVSAVVALAVGSILLFSFATKTGRRKLHGALPECKQSTEVYAVGSCQKFMTHMHNCHHVDIDWFSDFVNAVNKEAGSLGKTKLRELRLPSGRTFNMNSPIPASAYALFDKEQFVFPTCHIGTQYSIDLPSVNRNINVTGISSVLM